MPEAPASCSPLSMSDSVHNRFMAEDDAVAQVTQAILAAIAQAAGSIEFPASGDALQRGVAACLTPSERELKARFARPAIPPRFPPKQAVDELAARRPPRVLPPTGRDPCAAGAKLDVLWHSPLDPIAIELKYCEQWKSDVNGYQFLKDVHRLERMVSGGRSPGRSRSRRVTCCHPATGCSMTRRALTRSGIRTRRSFFPATTLCDGPSCAPRGSACSYP